MTAVAEQTGAWLAEFTQLPAAAPWVRELREAANSAALTYSDAGEPVPFSAGLEWQVRQSPLDIPSE